MLNATDITTLVGAVGALIAAITGLVVALKTKGDVTQIKSVTTDTQKGLHEAGMMDPEK